MKIKCIICLIICILSINCIAFAGTKGQVISAINKTYTVRDVGPYRLPQDVITKAQNYLNAHELSSNDYDRILGAINKAVGLANELGTMTVEEIPDSDIQKGVNLINEASNAADVNVVITKEMIKSYSKGSNNKGKNQHKNSNASDNKTSVNIQITDKNNKVLEEINVGAPFFKQTGKNIKIGYVILIVNTIIVCLIVIILKRKIKKESILYSCALICNFVLIFVNVFLIFINSEYVKNILNLVINNKGNIEILEKSINSVECIGNVIYPTYGEQYGILNIESCNINLKIFYGDNYQILEKGIGHYSGSNLPGEGRTILLTTHNTIDKLYNLKNIKNGDNITISTNYGTFNYTVYNYEIIDENDKSKVDFESNEETLVIYTCYPFNSMGETKQRFIVYAKKVG